MFFVFCSWCHCNYCACCTFNPLALLMALRGLSTLSTLRIFTTEIALDLWITHGKKFAMNFSVFNPEYEKQLYECRTWWFPGVDSLHPHGQQRDSDHNQIQDVKGVTAEWACVHKCSIHCHLSMRHELEPRHWTRTTTEKIDVSIWLFQC